MNYYIKKIDRKEFEYNFVNCDTCKIFVSGFLMGRYDFNKNKFFSDGCDWCMTNYFKKLTDRQKDLVLIHANKYFIKIYEKALKKWLNSGESFTPTDENFDKTTYYLKAISQCRKNIDEIFNNKMLKTRRF